MKRIVFFICCVFMTLCLKAENSTKVTFGPWIAQANETEVVIKWVTYGNTMGWVEVKEDDGTNWYQRERMTFYEHYAGRKLTGTKHTVVIKGLKPGQKYQYRVCNQELIDDSNPYKMIFGVRTGVGINTFKTLNKNAKTCRMTMVNDIHGNEELFSDLLKGKTGDDMDFLVCNGDMMTQVHEIDTVIKSCIGPVSKLVKNTPYLYVRGNHEGRGSDFYKLDQVWQSNNGGWYYTLRQGPVAILVLDAGEDKSDDDLEYAGTACYEVYRAEELEWLKKAVKEPDFVNAPVKVVIQHIPLFNDEDSWYGQRRAYELFYPVLKDAGITVAIHGHYHRHLYVKAGESTNFPVVVNSNDERLEFESDGEKTTINIFDRGGKLVHTYSF